MEASRAAGHPAFGSRPVGQPAGNPGLERRETWGTRLRLPGLRAGRAGSSQGKKRFAPDDVKSSWTPGLWVATCGSAGEEPRSRKARDLGHPAQTPWASLGTGSLQGKKRVAPDDVKNSWDTRPLGRHLWVSRRGTQVSKGARPGAPGSDSWASLGTGSSQGKKRVAPDDVKNSWTPGLWVATCGSAGEEPRSRKARDLGHPASLWKFKLNHHRARKA